jgi:hypothetical protein
MVSGPQRGKSSTPGNNTFDETSGRTGGAPSTWFRGVLREGQASSLRSEVLREDPRRVRLVSFRYMVCLVDETGRLR